MGVEPQGAPGEVVARPQGIGPSGFERNGVDRVPESDRTSTPGTFFVRLRRRLGRPGRHRVRLGRHDLRARPVGHDRRDRRRHHRRADPARAADPHRVATATNNATSSGATFGVRGRLIGSGIGLLTCLFSVALTVWTSGSAGVAVAGTAVRAARHARHGGRGLRAGRGRLGGGGDLGFPLAGALHDDHLRARRAGDDPHAVAFGGAISWGYEGSEPLLGSFWPTWFLVATTVGVSGALLVCTILGDWTRYIRSDRHPPQRLAWIGSLGIFLGFVVPAAIGAIVTTALTDPQRPSRSASPADSPTLVRRAAAAVRRVRRRRARRAVALQRGPRPGGARRPAHPRPGHRDHRGDRRRPRLPRAARADGAGLDRRGVPRARRAERAVGGDRRHRVPAHRRPLRRRRPAGVQPAPHRRPVLVQRRLELAGRRSRGPSARSSGC